MTTAVNARPGRAHLSRTLVVVLAGIVMFSVPAISPMPVMSASLKDQISATKKRQGDISKSIARQEAVIKGLRQDQVATRGALREIGAELRGINVDQTKVKERIQRTEEALDRAQARHDRLIDDLRQTDFTLGLLERELRSGEEDLLTRRAALGLRLAEAYRAENTTLLEQVFTAETFSDVLTQASAYLSYGDQDAQLAKEITEDQQALDTLRLLTMSTRLQTDKLRRDTVEAQKEIRARRADLNVQKRKLEALEKKTERIQAQQQSRYRMIVKNARQAKRIRAKQVAAKLALQRRIAGLVRKAQAQAARRAGSGLASSGNGRFIWPTRGTITQGYGCTGFSLEPRRGSCAGFHDGIDIANSAGTPIRAAGDGVVAFIGYRPDGAFVVVMGHAGGYETVYGHMLPTYPVRVGQFVKRGTVIGKMGSTGYSTGNHLHWEVSKGFSTMDPRGFV